MFLDYQLAYGTSLFQMKAALIEKTFFRKSLSETLTELCNASTSHFIQIGFASFLPVAQPQ